MKKVWIRIVGFGLLAAVMVGVFLFNLNLLLGNGYDWRYLDEVLFGGLGALVSVALLVWAVVSAMREARGEPEPEAPTSQEKWEAKYPKPAWEPGAERPKEKHGPGYWIKEFMRLAGFPVLLILAIWLGTYYLILEPLFSK